MPSRTNGVVLAVLNASARYENINLEKFYLTGTAVNSGGWDQIRQIHIYKGTELVKSITPTSTDGTDKTVLVDITNSPIVVPKDSTTLITVKGDTANSNYELGSTGASGQGLSVKINAVGDVTAKGAQSGTTLTSTSLTLSNAAGNSMYLFRSTPTITPNDQLGSDKVSSQTLLGGSLEYELYKFKVTASSVSDTEDTGGGIGLHSVSFLFSTSSATATEVFLYDGSTKIAAATSSPATHLTNNRQSDVQVLTFVLTTNGAVETFQTMLPNNSLIAAGYSKTYTLKGTITCGTLGANDCSGTSGTGSVSVQLLGDGSVATTLPTTITKDPATMAFDRSIQWADWWRTPVLKNASTTATITEQWANGYLVKNSTGQDLAATSSAVTISR